MDLSQLTHISRRERVTRIERQQIDRLINLADEFSDTKNASSLTLLEDGDVTRALSGLVEVAKTKFCLYCLAIINCYAVLENNRNEIVGKVFNDVRRLEIHLTREGICHQNVRCYKTMDEFRLVNNAIKHSRLSGATTVVAQNGNTYGTRELKALYKKSIHLDSYLADLFRRIEKTV
jgi:hypothetical protein